MSQIFRKPVPIHIIYDLLDIVYNNEFSSDYYIFTISSYKKLCYNHHDTVFLSQIAPYYYNSKLYYVERQHTYKTFCTILRQICKINNIKITTKTTYYNSSYYMDYYIERKQHECKQMDTEIDKETEKEI